MISARTARSSRRNPRALEAVPPTGVAHPRTEFGRVVRVEQRAEAVGRPVQPVQLGCLGKHACAPAVPRGRVARVGDGEQPRRAARGQLQPAASTVVAVTLRLYRSIPVCSMRVPGQMGATQRCPLGFLETSSRCKRRRMRGKSEPQAKLLRIVCNALVTAATTSTTANQGRRVSTRPSMEYLPLVLSEPVRKAGGVNFLMGPLGAPR